MKAITLDIIITSIRSRKDGSLGFSSETPELTKEEKVAFFDLQGLNTKALLQPTDEPNTEVLKVKSDLDTKTQAQRIRSVLFVLWKQRGEKGEFKDFYQNKTERFIDGVKSLLD